MRHFFCLISLLCLPALILAAWHDDDRAFRRAVELETEEAKITGEELVNVRFMANGKQMADGKDIRVLTPAGKAVPARVLRAGPGDAIDLAFNALRGTRQYHVYFGSSEPAPDVAESLNTSGLLLEMKATGGESTSSTRETQALFDRMTRPVGARLIGKPFVGANLLTGPQATVSKVSGKLFAPISGSYTFAVAADDRAGLMIDDKPLLFCRHPVGDTRFQERLQLERGSHDFALYHIDTGGEYAFSVVWKRPDMDKFDVIGQEFFGPVIKATAGPLEERSKSFVADADFSYQGESFFAWNYSHRYRFSAVSTIRNIERLQVKWDFGDGQNAAGHEVEHVYLNPGTYAVTVEMRSGGNVDKQTFRLPVDRDVERLSNPPTDELGLHAKMVATYDLTKLSPEAAAWAVLMHLRANNFDEAAKAGRAMAAAKQHGNRSIAIKALEELIDEGLKQKQASRLVETLSAAGGENDLQPWIATRLANLLMYSTAEFTKALDAIQPFAKADDNARRAHGQALVLAGQFEQGKTVLEGLPVAAARQKVAALSGAMARSTEFYAEEKDAVHGEQAWEKWMTAFPADFLDGNSAVMRVRLIESRGNPTVAAKVAEAYANSNSQSAYAPRLLDLASKLLEKTDAAKSSALRQLLKQRYPEDPLSQK